MTFGQPVTNIEESSLVNIIESSNKVHEEIEEDYE